MVDGQFQHTQWRPFPVDGAVAVGRVVIRGIFEGQRFNGGAFFSVVLQNAHGAKHNDAAEMGGIFLRHDLILVDDTERRLTVPPDGVQLVAGFRTVEVQLGTVVDIAHGDGVGVAVVAGQGQHPRGSTVEDGGALLRGQELLFPAHFTKHRSTSFPNIGRPTQRGEYDKVFWLICPKTLHWNKANWP